MHSVICRSMGVLLGIMTGTVCAAVLFEDDFSSAASADNWAKQSGALTRTIDEGVYRVVNEGTSFGLLKHSNSFDDFTYSVTLVSGKTSWRTIGLVCCWQNDFTGYMFTVSSGQIYSIHKWQTDGAQATTVLLGQSWNSFVSETANRLTVSKRGTTLNFFCNDAFLMSVTETVSSAGDVGLAVDATQDVIFDDVLVTDDFVTGEPRQCLEDDFSSDALVGWNMLGLKGEATVDGGLLKIASTVDNNNSMLYTDGDYTGFSEIKTRLRFVDGDTNAFFGIMLMQVEVTEESPGQLRISYDRMNLFLINQHPDHPQYAVFEGGTYAGFTSTKIKGGNQWNELTVTSDLYLLANGDTLGNPYSDPTYAYNAAGLWVGNGAVVEFDNFSAGNPDACAAVPVRIPVPERVVPVSAMYRDAAIDGGRIYTAAGQLVRRFSGSADNALGTLVAGTYFVIFRETAGKRVMRTVVSVR